MNRLLTLLIVLVASSAGAANYPLEITAPQPSQTTQNRYYKTYTGLEYTVPIGVYGGEYPFTYSLTTAPSGMTIDEDYGIITWTNPVELGSPHAITVSVTDFEGSTDTVSWTLTVDTNNAVFLNSNVGDGGDGTIGSPLNELEDIWGDGSPSTYNDHFLYFRGGTYGLSGGWQENCPGQQCNVSWDFTRQPHVWIGVSNETVIIDHDLATDSNGMYLRAGNGSDDAWVNNINFQDMLNHAVRWAGSDSRQVIWDCEFTNGGPGADSENSSFVMLTGSATSTETYQLIKSNLFDTTSEYAYVKTYSTNKAVVEGNSFSNPSGTNEGLAIKAYDQYMSVRGNTFDGDFSAGSICGNMNYGRDYDISYNNVKNADTDGDAYTYGALNLNHDTTITGPIYVYRNTFEGAIQYRGDTGEGPCYIYDNVIVNNMSAVDDPDGSLVHPWPENNTSSTVVDIGTGDAANITGSTTDGVIDTSGLLTGTYRTTYLDLKGHEVTGLATPVDPECDSSHMSLCTTQLDCEGAGFYWYDSTCNATAEVVENTCEDGIEYCDNATDCNTYHGYEFYYLGECQLTAQEIITITDNTVYPFMSSTGQTWRISDDYVTDNLVTYGGETVTYGGENVTYGD